MPISASGMVIGAAKPRFPNLEAGRRVRADAKHAMFGSMSKRKRPGTKVRKKGFVIGRASFGKISAVEGVQLSPAMKKRAADAEREGLSAEEYRRTIVRSYRKA